MKVDLKGERRVVKTVNPMAARKAFSRAGWWVEATVVLLVYWRAVSRVVKMAGLLVSQMDGYSVVGLVC